MARPKSHTGRTTALPRCGARPYQEPHVRKHGVSHGREAHVVAPFSSKCRSNARITAEKHSSKDVRVPTSAAQRDVSAEILPEAAPVRAPQARTLAEEGRDFDAGTRPGKIRVFAGRSRP